jgi:hypothetical protein
VRSRPGRQRERLEALDRLGERGRRGEGQLGQPGLGGDPAGLVEQLADRDQVRLAAIADLERREVRPDRGVQVHLAFSSELHDRQRGERLAHRAQVERSVRGGVTHPAEQDRLAAADDSHRRAGGVVGAGLLPHVGLDPRDRGLPRGGRRAGGGRGRRRGRGWPEGQAEEDQGDGQGDPQSEDDFQHARCDHASRLAAGPPRRDRAGSRNRAGDIPTTGRTGACYCRPLTGTRRPGSGTARRSARPAPSAPRGCPSRPPGPRRAPRSGRPSGPC